MSATATTPAAPSARRFRFLGFTGAQGSAFLIMVAAIVILPLVGVYPVFLMKVLCFALFACAFNLLIGYVGLLSFGHAAYFGMGGYVTAWTAKTMGLTPEVAILLGGLTGGALGLAFGALAIRRQGIYFAMITLAPRPRWRISSACRPRSPAARTASSRCRAATCSASSRSAPIMAMYTLVAVIFIAGFLLVHRVVHSPFGWVLKAIRENEPRATSLGYRTNDYKLIAFVLSTFIAGIAGGTKSLVFGIATLTDVQNSTSGEVVLMTLLGGLGTIFGPVIGAGVIQSLEQYLAQFGSWVTVSQGVIFVFCVLAFRRGIIGEIAAKLRINL